MNKSSKCVIDSARHSSGGGTAVTCRFSCNPPTQNRQPLFLRTFQPSIFFDPNSRAAQKGDGQLGLDSDTAGVSGVRSLYSCCKDGRSGQVLFQSGGGSAACRAVACIKIRWSASLLFILASNSTVWTRCAHTITVPLSSLGHHKWSMWGWTEVPFRWHIWHIFVSQPYGRQFHPLFSKLQVIDDYCYLLEM